MSTFSRRSLSILVVVSFAIRSGNAFKFPCAGLASNNLSYSRTALRVIPFDGDGEKNKCEDSDIPPLKLNQPSTHTPSQMRMSRLEREKAIRSRFVTRDELRNLRDDLKSLKENLRWSQAAGDLRRVSELREAIRVSEEKDPELVYARAISAMNSAEKIKELDKRKFVIGQHRSEANLARMCIPRFNLEGLWVGK